MHAGHTVVLVDPEEETQGVLAGRLRMQGYSVTEARDSAEACQLTLASPPSVVIANLWMPKISGVQLCRLLRSELATRNVPVILRGPEGHRNRFWANQAGAAAYIIKGRMGDLVRAIGRAIAEAPPAEHYWSELGESIEDVRDRIAGHLDQALFDSVVASELRALGSCGDFDRLFDLFSQFLSQVTSYRWVAVATNHPRRFGLHSSPRLRGPNEVEARTALEFGEEVHVIPIEDDDAYCDERGPQPIVRDIKLGQELVGRVALAVREPMHPGDAALVDVLARELAGPLRIATLVEESRQLATTDGLTGLMNRRAFLAALDAEVARAHRHGHPLTVVMLDVDHFKKVNDTHGHASGDAVLEGVGTLLSRMSRRGDLVARWGGEEFVLSLHSTPVEGGVVAAERRRLGLTELEVVSTEGKPIPVSASFGVVQLNPGERSQDVIDRADRMMYRAKSAGRNRVDFEPRRDERAIPLAS